MSSLENDLFERVLATPSIASRLSPGARKREIVFEHVTEGAQPFLIAALAHRFAGKAQRMWVVCETEREQERLYAELATWTSRAVLFPHSEVAVIEGALPDPEVSAERLGVLQRLAESPESFVMVVTEQSLAGKVPSPNSLRKSTITLETGNREDRAGLVESLVKVGYEAVPSVSERGQFSVRGGIMDVFCWQQSLPVRIEWFDDQIESIREFDLHEQVSIRTLPHCALLTGAPESGNSSLREYIKKGDILLSIGDLEQKYNFRILTGASTHDQKTVEDYRSAFFPIEIATRAKHQSGTPGLRDAFDDETRRQLRNWFQGGFTAVISYTKDSEKSHFEEITRDITPKTDWVYYRRESGNSSFSFPEVRLVFLSAGAVLSHHHSTTIRTLPNAGRAGSSKQRSQIDFTELSEGELVVHLEHGLARFRGVQTRRVSMQAAAEGNKETEEVLVLEFADEAKLYVPLEQAYFVSRYVGLGKRGATLSHLGDGKWSSTKSTAEKSIYDYAAKLLKIQAVRDAQPGVTFGPDSQWQKDFESTFPYKETGDQVRAIDETKVDMESGRPMDRLICGDVGFGKTEVAIRAAFKAATDGKQVAMMVPTTVLAQQHFDNFRERMASFPVVVELLSRYRTHAEQQGVAAGLHDGSVDIVIGTHRLISNDIAFKNLGLLIVDEEQRFGVRHKERIKERFPSVDVLTLSATPIPRTLYMALTGARDLSTLETPPPNRYPVETVICSYDERIIRSAIDRELDREGQVYFLHNRVEDIEKVRARIMHLCPRARVDLGHGQMEEGQLEEVMHRFVSGQTDVLVATTIIESGLDIPNANTIVIDRADRFGLADLYQLRGRVGRGQHKAYAYLMLPRDLMTVGEARKRINAIKQYSSLGAGFKIALRDLEIRGAGNILGLAQSGHLTAVGFDLYCQLLSQAVSKLRGEKVRHRVEVVLRIDFVAAGETDFRLRSAAATGAKPSTGSAGRTGAVADEDPAASASALPAALPAFVPAAYIEDSRQRIQAYRQLAAITRAKEVEQLRDSWRDRFGPLPEPAENILGLTRLKLLASSRKVQQVEVKGEKLMLTRAGDYVLDRGRFPRLTSTDPASKISEISSILTSL